MNIRNHIYATYITIKDGRIMQLYGMLMVCMLNFANAFAQEATLPQQSVAQDTVMRKAGGTAPTIIIGGDVYGGGLEGKVGVAPAEGQEITAEQANTEVTNVTIAGGQLRTVFGGGKNGEVFGKTTVSIKGGEIGADKWEGTPYGGVYGGGEGASAIVHGHTDVTIGGGSNYNNVYGGGKQALLKGNSNVTLESGIIRNRVFAGARMADINGYGLVNIVGDNSEDADMLIVRAVYGGNDISGSIFNRGKNKPSGLTFKVDEQGLPEALASFVFTQNTATNVFIGNVFGGGNGDYKYENDLDNEGKLQINLVEEQLPNDEDETIVTFKNLNKPEADYAYLQIEGGTFGNIYGGGNNATILKQTDIYYGIDDAVIKPLKGIPSENLSWLQLYEGFTKDNDNNTFDLTYNAFRIFGGNNLAEMSIRPKWHLKSGTVGNIYSGGNKGKMTNPNGIILTITSPDLKAHNVYGGCRMADVEPKGVETIAEETYAYHSYKYKVPDGDNFVEKYDAQYEFKEGYAARVLVTDGKINNLYGGNDISGKVHFGTNVELRGAISGDVYGGGNGSYAYTDKAEWIKSHPEDADYFYESGSNSIDAMYAYRPHVEKTLLHITGIGSTAPPVYVTGGVYCGGNSATLAKDGNRDDATATFEIGKHVVINSVFLGSNGKNMVADDILQKYANNDFSSITLTDNAQFAKYMEAVAVNLKPTITWEWDDDAVPGMNDAGKDITNATEAYIGAFYCGGNVGSMTTREQMNMTFPKGLTIFDRIVGGCNSARIAAEDGLNAFHDGGVTTAMTDGRPKVVLNIDSRLEPRKMVLTYADGDQEKLFYSSASTEINTQTYEYGTDENKKEYSILHGANVYGGCYESGQINGDVEINVRRDIVSPDIPEEYMVSKNPEFLKDAGLVDSDGNALQNVPFAQYAFSTAMNVFGGGYGKDTEIKGMTTINLTEDARVMKVFGGGEMGTVLGKEYTDDNGITTRKGSYINISATKPAEATKYNTYMAYGGGYEGKVFGDVEVILNSGRLFDVYGGSCNADIEGSTYVQVGNGVSDVLEIKNSVYGANDFGGQLLKDKLWTIDNGAKAIRSRSHVVYNSGAIENELYGGAFGSYDYSKFVRDNIEGFKFPRQESPVNKLEGDDIAANTFVQIASQSTNANDYVKNGIYGGGRGFANATGIVDVHQTYVHLHSATYNSRYAASLFNPMTPAVYGGGYYSHVENTLVDAVTGHVGIIYGGTAGMSATKLNPEISYNAGTTTVNIYNGMDNTSMIVYGAGPLAGANTTNVHLYGGVADKVYGGAFAEGICSETNIFVPETSTVSVNALYGGSRGKQPNLPCDVIQSNINFLSDKASVTDAIFGGNDFMRATMHSLINITVPVKNLKADTLINVYAAGDGAGSIAGYTRAELSGRAEVRDIYGGGRNGLVLDGFDGAMNNNDLLAEYILEDSELSNLKTYYSETKNNLPTWDKLISETNTNVYLIGGQVKNIYGGGFNGDITGNTFVSIGKKQATSHGDGRRPTVLRSAYGGGQLACVKGNANISLYDGYIGYKYIAPSTSEGKGTYEPNIKISSIDELNLLDDNGNLYGGGYDEGGFVYNSYVNIYGGVVRNSVYGGGEIAAIGEGEMESPGSYKLKTITTPGSSNVYMHGGLVERNVFGGGRGFSYNESGGTIIGKKYYTDGFTFGKTSVEIHRGTVGTDASVALGHGNVFGGGNVGFVYSDATRNDADGYYYKNEKLTEDCRVVVSAHGIVKESAGDEGLFFKDNDGDDELLEEKTFKKGEAIPTAYLNLLASGDERWNHIDQTGIVIRNAVFAGGNVSIGDDKLYANTYTVYGNCTASVIDVRNKDLVSLGGHEIGGLYGDGNLTLVDGYRELNITNYGTDYHNLQNNISYDEYNQLTSREREYYELKSEYICKKDFTYTYTENGNTITKTYKANENNEDHIINETVYNFIVDKLTEQKLAGNSNLSEKEAKTEVITYLNDYFEMHSLCNLYNGRMMNTIQRADFCGMFGSRILLKGALDRVINVADNTKYTINRIGELSLNQDKFKQNGEDKIHGNYFGIYSIVNYLGALTSDVLFTEPRVTDNEKYKGDGYGTLTYKEWKTNHLNDKSRNIGKSKNTVALASGVYLELVKGLDNNNQKDYGFVTGIIGLDLINVARGEGGGFVYAKNEHGEQISTSLEQVTLAASNKGARSNKSYDYDHSKTSRMHSSGNFVNDIKLIVDDCYPRNNSFSGENASVAHMWYIKGDHYVYDLTISAYTGASQAYDRVTNTSLNVTAGSDGRVELKEIGRNRYAYFVGMSYNDKTLTASDYIVAGSNVYYLNDPITYWDWSRLSEEEKRFFTDNPNKDTYICNKDFTVDDQSFTKGEVITHIAYEALAGKTIKNEEGKDVSVQTYFNISNAVSKDNGFLLTIDISNPTVWDDYYNSQTGNNKRLGSKLTLEEKAQMLLAPTFTCTSGGIFGQQSYKEHDLIDETTKTNYDAITQPKPTGQATVEKAYIAKKNLAVVVGNQTYHYVEGACMSLTHYNALSETDKQSSATPAYICTETVKMNDESGQHYIYGVAISDNEYNELITANDALYSSCFEPAYICTTDGYYGGKYFVKDKNYPALDYCGVNNNERGNFTFNEDAFDLLRHGFDLTDDSQVGEHGAPWSERQRVDYTAIFSGAEIPDGSISVDVTYNNAEGTETTTNITIQSGMEPLDNYVYEALPNEQARYSQISINDDDNNTCYIVETTFFTGDRMYRAGTKLTTNEYEQMSDNLKPFIGKYDFTGTGTYYYCHEAYKAYTTVGSIHEGSEVPTGTIISGTDYAQLKNYQKYFIIQGEMPKITSTLYVAPEIGISDLEKERIVTAVYEYTYKEFNGSSYENIVEKHIVNIHVDFESGAPSVGRLMPPATILPGQNVSINKPGVERGAYEVLGGNWEMYTNQTDAQSHTNGQRIENGSTPLFWYQNGYWVAYYAESFLGRTYSNAVQLSIANYHDINNMMNHVVDGKHEYLYVDEPTVMRNSKIYIDDRECTDNTKSELDLLYDFYNNTQTNELNEHVKNGANLDFHINSDVTTKKTEWQPIGDAEQCFKGSLHGNGHTIYGLDHSLFGNLCGKVYNLGVTGSFNGGGISDNGGTVTNSWINTTAKDINTETTSAVIGTGGTIINCYYPSNLTYKAGTAMPRSAADFLKGKVAYDLNRYYLEARKAIADNASTGKPFSYIKANNDGSLETNPDGVTQKILEAYYNDADYDTYVEDYFGNVDFTYSDGTLPLENDIRLSTNDAKYYPIYPDDYIFFGQTLNYFENYHGETPSVIQKNDKRMLERTDYSSNRVYRAPAYRMSSTLNAESPAVYFNRYAVFASQYRSTPVDETLTAIDFTGNSGKETGIAVDYSPLLDYEGLAGFATRGITQNLLVYADARDNQSHTVLQTGLPEPALEYGENNCVQPLPATTIATVNGHLVDFDGSNYTSPRTHFLVDKQNFNAPIAYSYVNGKAMWYQRKPETFIDIIKGTTHGWDAVSLPFTAGMVTTHQKGDITHFYGTEDKAHEYWLRSAVKMVKMSDDDKSMVFNRPTLTDNALFYKDSYKTENSFLYSYYYQHNDKKGDSNTNSSLQDNTVAGDNYGGIQTGNHGNYYKSERTYTDYLYLTGGVPYIIGFPGERFYEFDMSGKFQPDYSSASIPALDAQTVTYISLLNENIPVSDEQTESKKTAIDGYAYTATYQAQSLSDIYTVNASGTAFEPATTTVPFRPYLAVSSSSAKKHKAINISYEATAIKDTDFDRAHGLRIYAKNRTIHVDSYLEVETDVNIYNTAGVLISSFRILPGEQRQVSVASGIYIVNRKKLSVN